MKKPAGENWFTEQANAGLGIVRDLFRAARVTTPEGQSAWGQFLDPHASSKQYGVYGTASGVRALVLAGEPIASDEIAGATRQLQLEWKCETGKQKQKEPLTDPYITYKAVWLLEALCPGQEYVSNGESAEWYAALFARQLPDGGWGDYWCSAEPGTRSESSSVLATAFATGCLARYPAFVGDGERRARAVGRLQQEVDAHPRLDPAVLGVVLWALSRLPNPSESERTLARLLRTRLIRHIRHLRRRGIGPSYVLFYDVSDRYHYLHVPVLVVALLALLQNDARLAYDRNVRRATKALMQQVVGDNGLRAEETSRLSSVDHCWLALLLRKVLDVGDRWSTAPLLEAVLDPAVCRWKGATTWSVLLAVGTAGIWLGLKSASMLLKAIGTLVSLVLLTLLVNLFTGWLQRLRR